MKKKLMDYLLCAVLVAGLMAACLWFTEGILRIVLLVVLYVLETEILTSIVRLVLGEPEPQKLPKEEMIRAENQWYLDRQNTLTASQLTPWKTLLIVVSVILLFWGMVGNGSYEIYSAICLVFAAVCAALAVLFPGYFSLIYSDSDREKNPGLTFPIVNVSMPMILALFGCSYRSLETFRFTSWMSVLEGVVLTAAALGLTVPFFPELRRSNSNRIGALVMALILSFGFLVPANHLLEKNPPEIVSATVTEYHPGRYRNPPDYDLLLEDGQEINLPAKMGFGRLVFEIGEEIQLEFHEGAFGIDYYCYPN